MSYIGPVYGFRYRPGQFYLENSTKRESEQVQIY